MIDSIQRAFQKFVRDKEGRIAVWQTPNLPLVAWIVFKMLSMVVAQKNLQDGFSLISSAFLFTWAFLEMTEGDSYFRRVIGLVVFAALLVGFFR